MESFVLSKKETQSSCSNLSCWYIRASKKALSRWYIRASNKIHFIQSAEHCYSSIRWLGWFSSEQPDNIKIPFNPPIFLDNNSWTHCDLNESYPVASCSRVMYVLLTVVLIIGQYPMHHWTSRCPICNLYNINLIFVWIPHIIDTISKLPICFQFCWF